MDSDFIFRSHEESVIKSLIFTQMFCVSYRWLKCGYTYRIAYEGKTKVLHEDEHSSTYVSKDFCFWGCERHLRNMRRNFRSWRVLSVELESRNMRITGLTQLI